MKDLPEVPEVEGIDLDFAPRTYFILRDLHLPLPSDIKGKARRDLARSLAARGEEIPEAYLASDPSDEDRSAWGQIHPAFMGGEYLPPLLPGEVEIARVSLASVTSDQISVRARRSGKAIEYRIVDEYGDGTLVSTRHGTRQSRSPLRMRDLVAFMDGACSDGGIVIGPIAVNIDAGSDPESLLDFVSVESDFYPQLAMYYGARRRSWLDDWMKAEGGGG